MTRRCKLKPWPNGVASYRKLQTCGNLRLRLATACVDVRWLAMTCVHIELKFLRKRTQVFNRLATQRKLALVLFSLVRVSVRGCPEIAYFLLELNLRLLAIPFGHPSQVNVHKFTLPNLR